MRTTNKVYNTKKSLPPILTLPEEIVQTQGELVQNSINHQATASDSQHTGSRLESGDEQTESSNVPNQTSQQRTRVQPTSYQTQDNSQYVDMEAQLEVEGTGQQ